MRTSAVLTPVRQSGDEARRVQNAAVDAHASIHEARELAAATGQDVLLVIESGRPVAVVTTEQLWSANGGPVFPDAEVLDVVRWELVRLAPDSDIEHTLRHYSEAAWTSLKRRRP